MFGRGIASTIGVMVVAVFAGFVGYKVIEKKNPDLIKKAKKSMSDVKEKTSEMIDGAKKSFKEGYSSST